MVVAILVLPGAALSHLSVRPGLLESGREQILRIELPELRLGRQASTLDVSGPGVRMLASDLTGGRGEESRWRVRVDVQAESGPIVLLLRAGFADGRSVTLRQAMTVLPASAPPASTRSGLAAGLGVLGLLTGVAALVLLRRARFK